MPPRCRGFATLKPNARGSTALFGPDLSPVLAHRAPCPRPYGATVPDTCAPPQACTAPLVRDGPLTKPDGSEWVFPCCGSQVVHTRLGTISPPGRYRKVSISGRRL